MDKKSVKRPEMMHDATGDVKKRQKTGAHTHRGTTLSSAAK